LRPLFTHRLLFLAIATAGMSAYGHSDTVPVAPAPPIVLRPCVYVVQRVEDVYNDRDNVPLNGGSFSYVHMIRTSGQCSWQAASNDSWITVVTPSGGDGDTIRFTVQEVLNLSPPSASIPRHGTILISWLDGQMAVIVTQTSCRYFPIPASLAVLAGGGTFIYSPSSSGNCRLPSPSADVEWLRDGQPVEWRRIADGRAAGWCAVRRSRSRQR